jgi:Tfp pilus assembly protein PilN
MKRITINLHPLHHKEEDRIYATIAKYIPYVFLGLIGLVVVNIFLFLLVSLSRLGYKSAAEQWKTFSPQVETVTALKKEVEALTAERNEYSGLFAARVETSRMLADIFASLPKNIWLERIEFNNDNLNFSGYVVRWKEDYLVSLDKFIKNMGKSEYFSTVFKEISLKNSRKNNLHNVEVVRFVIECKK